MKLLQCFWSKVFSENTIYWSVLLDQFTGVIFIYLRIQKPASIVPVMKIGVNIKKKKYKGNKVTFTVSFEHDEISIHTFGLLEKET